MVSATMTDYKNIETCRFIRHLENILVLTTSYITISWFILNENAPVHRSVLVDFSAKNNVTILEHPHSPDQAPTDFYLFPPPK